MGVFESTLRLDRCVGAPRRAVDTQINHGNFQLLFYIVINYYKFICLYLNI
jgi:hypothetical protein